MRKARKNTQRVSRGLQSEQSGRARFTAESSCFMELLPFVKSAVIFYLEAGRLLFLNWYSTEQCASSENF